MSWSFIITPLLFMMAFSAAEDISELVQPSAVVGDDFSDTPETPFLLAASMIRRARLSSTTVTLISTTTISSVTSVSVTTKKTCAVLASGVTINGITTLTTTPATTCRRRRLYWDQPVFVAFQGDDNLAMQFHEINPAQLLRLEPTMFVPEFRNSNNPNIKKAPAQSNRNKGGVSAIVKVQQKPKTSAATVSPSIIEPSLEYEFEQSFDNIRIAQPIYFTALTSIISTILSNFLTSTSTSTSIVSVYTSTFTSTSYTATSSYYVAGACYPSGLSTC